MMRRTARKRVGNARQFHARIAAAVAEMPVIPDPEMYEQQHDDALLAEVDPAVDPEMDADEDPESDPEEDPTEDPESDPEMDSEDEPESDPEEDPEEDPEDDPEMGADEGTESDSEEEVEEDLAIPMDEAVDVPVMQIPPLPAVVPLTPPPPPLSPSDGEDYDTLTPVQYEIEDAPPADPGTPPLEVVPAFLYDWMAANAAAELAASEGRLAEARAELAAEREAQAAAPGGVRFIAPRATEREMTRIEIGARIRLRMLPVDDEGRVARADAEEIFRGGMERVRALTRPAGDP